MNLIDETRLGWIAATVESVSDLVFISDLKDRFIYINPAALKKLGYTKEEIIGQTAEMIMSPKNSSSLRGKILKATLEDPNGWEGEVINIAKDGQEYLAHLKTALVKNKRGKVIGMTGISRDITEKTKAQEELRKYASKLEEANKRLYETQAQLVRSEKLSAIGLLAAGIAHEIGNPLASLSSLVQLLTRKISDKKAINNLEQMHNHIDRISHIIHKVSDFSKRESHVLLAVKVQPAMQKAIQTILDEKKSFKRVEFRMFFEKESFSVQAEPRQLSQIFLYILQNAWDAIEWEGKIMISAKAHFDKVSIFIEDNGRGIPKVQLQRIFEPFFTTKDVGKGTGMGLAVSYGIVQSFGGDIRIESVEGKGTKVIVVLNRSKEVEDEAM